MTTMHHLGNALPVPPSVLPPVERRPAIPRGFLAGGATVGIKGSGRPDLAVVTTVRGTEGLFPAAAAAVFTPNKMAAAPVRLSRANLLITAPEGEGRWGWATAVISTSGSANAATGAAGEADQRAILAGLAAALRTTPAGTLAMSTGLIGTRLPLDKVLPGIDEIVARGLTANDTGFENAAIALRTTDSRSKVATTTVSLPDAAGAPVTVRVSGMAKGVGMIHPRMATMLSLILTDATAQPELLSGLLRPAAARTWDQLSIDGDTSTNDTVIVLASGDAGNAPIVAGSEAAIALGQAIEAVARDLARQQAADGEGATTLLTCHVTGGTDDAEARAVARAVVSSSLVKAAIHGRDPNWGRIVGAAGNARLAEAAVLVAAGLAEAEAIARAAQPATLDADRLKVAIAGTLVFDGPAGGPVEFDRPAVRAAMDGPECLIRLDLGLGDGSGEAFGCDLTETYVRENSEYST